MRPRLFLMQLALAWAALAAPIGCGPPRPATVRVTGRVVPLAGVWPTAGMLIFLPDVGQSTAASRPGRAVFGPDGRFMAVSFSSGAGLLPGRYRVVVQCGEPVPEADGPTQSHVTARYAAAATTDLVLDVPAGSRGVEAVFELQP